MTTPSELGAVAILILSALYAGRQLADRDPRPSPDGRVMAPLSVAWAGGSGRLRLARRDGAGSGRWRLRVAAVSTQEPATNADQVSGSDVTFAGGGPRVEAAERALTLADDAEVRLDLEDAVTHLSAAVRGFTASGDRHRAAMACARLGDVMANGFGNLTAARAWFARARRLVDDDPPCLEQGWVAVAAMGCDVDDPAELLDAAELALDRARRFGDVNLETKALADAGLALVQRGRVSDGMAMLDEAMALACGPADDTGVAAKSACSFFTACYYASDFERAGRWAELLRRHGLIGPAPDGPAFLSSHCDSVQATLLVELGRWGEAEAVLTRAIAEFESVMPVPVRHPAIALANLRIRQGRLAEAEALLLGKDQTIEALLPAARLHLARGDYDLGRATARRGLRCMRDDRLRAIELVTLMAEAELAAGDLDAAAAAVAELVERTRGVDVPALQARGAVAQARVLAACGSLDSAIKVLEGSVDALDPTQSPWLHATLLLRLAGIRDQAGDNAAARVDARTARAAVADLDVVLPPEDRALLDRLAPDGATVNGPRRPPQTAMLARDGKWWTVACGDTTARLPNSKGLRYLAELMARPGVERHALDLVDRVEGVDPDGELDRRALGDAGPAVDAQARAAYRRRVEELRAAADDALAEGRLAAAEAAQSELDQLVAQLAQAFGLGGRDRRAASAAERARLNVTRALRSALARLREAMPATTAVSLLDARVRTGTYCAYEPAADDEIRWTVRA
jgi:hypothetical protein